MTKMKLITITLAVALAMPIVAAAQTTASGTLTVNATVQSSISLVFNSDAAGVVLGGAGTNAATMNLGTISAYGPLSAGVGRSVTAGTSFTVTSPFDVQVDKSNITSSNYTLTAQLNAADATNTWAISGSGVTNASATTLTATGAYGSSTQYTLGLTVPLTSGAGAISNIVNFAATAN
ncbi:MAG TPA: hypothetical protein VFU76_04210 [Terriglobales bacterium]|nr:hypothetical protein [Terriglobales bacterium]